MPRQWAQHTRELDAAEKRALTLFGTVTRAAARDSLVYGPYLNADARCSITTAAGGACTKLRRKYARPKPSYAVPRRGNVREFSRKSRTRLQQTLCAMPIAHVGRGLLFITLTYPKEYPGEWQKWKSQLHHLTVKLGRKFPSLGGVWKLEPQTRGAPHFHLLTVGVPFLAADWLRRAWSRILQPNLETPTTVRIDIQLARSHRGVVSYASKYVAKAQQLPHDWQDGVGRWWGTFGRKNIGIVWKWAPLEQHQYFASLRIIRRLVANRRRPQMRGPPRPCPSGTWAVLKDWQALRIARCVLDIPRTANSWAETEYDLARLDTVSRTAMSDYLRRRPQASELADQCAAALGLKSRHAAPEGHAL